jgi:uncharacterized protein
MTAFRYRAMWLIFFTPIFIQIFGGYLYFVVFTSTYYVHVAYVVTKLIMLTVPILLIYCGFKLPRFSISAKVMKSIALGLMSGIAISVLIFGVFTLFQATFLTFTDRIAIKVVDFGIIQHYFLFAIGVSLVHSLFEEYFWRWYVVRGLETKLKSVHAVILGALLFAGHHYILLSQFFSFEIMLLFGTIVGVGGAIWSCIYKKTGSLLGAWISHAIVDGTLFYIGWILLKI